MTPNPTRFPQPQSSPIPAMHPHPKTLRLASVLCGLAAALLVPSPAAERAQPLANLDDDAEFARLHALAKPTEAESRWLEIPWSTDLWEARRQAAAEGKPILLWEMDGHPLGCT